MAPLQIRTLLSALLLTSFAGAVQPVWANLPISQQPLTLPNKVKPAFIMSLDNSGSIGSDETLCRTSQGECAFKNTAGGVQGTFFSDAAGDMFDAGTGGTTSHVRVMRGNSATAGPATDAAGNSELPRVDIYGAGRDPEYNRAYFDPAQSYTPWVNFDGSPYLGACPGGACSSTSSNGGAVGSLISNYIDQTTGNANYKDAPEDARHPALATDGSSATTIDFTTRVNVTYTYGVGDTIPAGDTFIWSTAGGTLNCTDLKNKYAVANNTPVTLAASYTIPAANCAGVITTTWLPATVYLTTNTAAAPHAIVGFDLTKVITVPKAGPGGTNLYKYELTPQNFTANNKYIDAIQNFANYWTYYADRARAIVAAATQSFSGVDFLRVGKFDISPICSGVGNCSPLTSGTAYKFKIGGVNPYISGPDSKYNSQPAGDPLVTMFDMSDYTYKTGVAINPIPPVGAVFSATGGDRSQFYDSIYKFDRPNNNTPTRRAVFRIGHQFMRKAGDTTSDGLQVDNNPPVLLECQANAGMLFTDGYINDDNGGFPGGAGAGTGSVVGNVDAGSTLGGIPNNPAGPAVTLFGTAPFTDGNPDTMADITAYYYQQNLRPDLPPGKVQIAVGCPNAKLDCNPNPHMNFYGIPLGARGKFYDVAPYVDNLGTPNIDEATNAAFTTPPAWAAKGLCNGCGGNTDLSPPAVDDIWHASINSRGKFISAQSPAAVRDGIRTVINALLNASLLGGTLPVTGVRLGAGSLTYGTSFTVAGNDWSGDLVATQLDTTGADIPNSGWKASTGLDALSDAARGNRKIFVDTNVGGAGIATLFDRGNVSALGVTQSAQLSFMGLNPSTFAALYGAATTSQMVVDFLKGDNSQDLNHGGPFRVHTHVLGDIVDSSPTVESSKDDFGFTSLPAPLGGGVTYTNFVTAKGARSPKTTVFVGANDGMLHAFDGTAAGGNELFGFIPFSVTGNLGALINPDYVHNFYVDGGMEVFNAYIGAPKIWRTVLVGSTGAGGSGAFALDVSNPSTFTAANVMWEVSSKSSADVGFDVGTPVVILAEDDNWYTAFGNGFNSTNSNPALIVVNMTSGTIASTLVGNDGGAFDNGIAQIAAIDADGNGKVDTIYGGDYRGNLWKFDLSSASVASWNVAFGNKPLYVAADGSGTIQPITSGIEVAPGPLGGQMVYFGTGSFFLTTDNTIPVPAPVQTLYAVWDNNTPDLTGRASLQQQSITAQTDGALITRSTTANPITYTAGAGTQRGFFMDMISPGDPTPNPPITAGPKGEKFFGTARVENNIVFFTTFEPNGDTCKPGGNNWEYGLNALTGAPALSDLAIGNLNGTKVCPGGGCGSVQIGTGAPVKETSIVIPPPAACIPGVDAGCPIPAEICNAGVCTPPPPIPDSALYSACTIIVRAQGAPPLALPRPCGRQSWRQVR